MTRLKRAILFVLLSAVLLCLCACGGAKTDTVKKLTVKRDGNRIACELYLPAGNGPFPTAVLCHGYGDNMDTLRPYAEALRKEGYAACIFDFIGGGPRIQSDGEMVDMSVLTEAADLNAVLDALRKRADVDEDNLVLIGESQGGFVVTYVAGQHPEEIRALIPLYPGYGMQDYVRARVKNEEERAETYNMFGQTVGRLYVDDALSFEIEDSMAAYDGPVLIIHGSRDPVAPISYSERALEYFPSAELKTLVGATHGFQGEYAEAAIEEMLSFLQDHTTRAAG